MAREIERKYLVTSQEFKDMTTEIKYIRQGYLSTDARATVRVRICDDQAYITVKGLNSGASRSEWEYEIAVADAEEMLNECAVTPVIEKKRYIVDGRWEIDEFYGHLKGLIVAEIELKCEDEQIDKPQFVGREVTGDIRYYNSSLSIATELPPIL